MASASTPATSGPCPRICSGRTMFTCLRRPPVVASSIVSVIDSKPWYCLTIFFTVVLLLASDVRDLWFSQKAELAFNVILTCTLSFLLLDVILRSIADPDYFAISILGKAFRPTTEQVDHGFGTLLRIGSFLFWCDLVSTLFLIFDIEWFVSFRFVKQTIEIQIDELGSPISGTKIYNEDNPIQFRSYLAVGIAINICRVLSVARFLLKASTIVKISSKVNWCWLPDRLGPSFWCRGKTGASDILSESADGTPAMEGHNNEGVNGRKENSKSIPIRKHGRQKPSGTPTTSGAEARTKSRIGRAMRELTGQRVATGIIAASILTMFLTYTEVDSTRATTMIVLHNQTEFEAFRKASLDAARTTAIPELYEYSTGADRDPVMFGRYAEDLDLREREKLKITIVKKVTGGGISNRTTYGEFSNRETYCDAARVKLVVTIFILFVWFLGVTAFVSPLMTLVVTPIERMIILLGMLMKDPLGFQGTRKYKEFVAQEDIYTKNTKWTKDVLNGMETSFLMSTILRIGSLMKVGFGAAGVQVIRKRLEEGELGDSLVLNNQGVSVHCIFLFCDIRSFTDATEALQEEVFVFTNKIASVVHSICSSYGGSANKNIGDAFLMSWQLGGDDNDRGNDDASGSTGDRRGELTKRQLQADSALLAVVKICICLYHDKYYVEDMSDLKKGRLLAKIATRKGPVVQMGCGLHMGKAVQGAIGTQRKLDATYVSEATEFAEFLESSTKQYGTKMLMSGAFHDVLSPQTKRRCRKVDKLLLLEDDMDPDDPDLLDIGEMVDLYTFDMDIDELWKHRARNRAYREEGQVDAPHSLSREDVNFDLNERGVPINMPKLTLPTGPARYSLESWNSEDMRVIREKYTDGLFFPEFNSALNAYYAGNWKEAKKTFEKILGRVNDGPSRYLLSQIEKNNGVPPRKFIGYNVIA